MDYFSTAELMACGQFEFEQERFPAALGYFKNALSREDCSNKLNASVARTYAKLKLFDEAKHHFEVFLEHYPDAYIERFQLGLVFKDLGNEQLALEVFETVLAQQPEFVPASYYKALTHLSLEQTESAKFLLNDILSRVEPDNLYVKLTKELDEKLGLKLEGLSENIQ
ncbi:MAG: tetratricopeptide repeat protein [Gammaproteobacteria bacterium]|nr:tetratricopeptide repeat protein [Gammaproteobacteria bacterium]